MSPEERSLVAALFILPGRRQSMSKEQFLREFGAADGVTLGLDLLRDPVDVELALVVCFSFGFTDDHLQSLRTEGGEGPTTSPVDRARPKRPPRFHRSGRQPVRVAGLRPVGQRHRHHRDRDRAHGLPVSPDGRGRRQGPDGRPLVRPRLEPAERGLQVPAQRDPVLRQTRRPVVMAGEPISLTPAIAAPRRFSSPRSGPVAAGPNPATPAPPRRR